MEIIFKKGSKQIEHVENAEKLTYEKQNELIEKYDNEDIISYEIRFKPDIKVSISHDFDNIHPEMLKSIIITIGKVKKCPKCGSDKKLECLIQITTSVSIVVIGIPQVLFKLADNGSQVALVANITDAVE